MVELKRKVTLKHKVTSTDEVEVTTTDGSRKGNRWKWISGIVALFLVGGAIYYFNQNGSTDNTDIAIAVSDSTSTQTAKSDSTKGSTEVVPSDNTSDENAGIKESNIDNSPKNQHSNVTQNKVNENTLDKEVIDVEEKARKVIRGDYGNGNIRKQKLGEEYSEIQSAVNEMYRKGLVK